MDSRVPTVIALLGVAMVIVGVAGDRPPLAIVGAALIVVAAARFLLGSRG